MQRVHVLFLSAIFVACGALAYDNLIAHPGLTQAAIEVFNHQAVKQLTIEQANWIIHGSIAEDAIPRFINHYYNPRTNQGFDGNKTAKDWALGGSCGGVAGDFSEQAALQNYRDGNYQRAYECIGHINHLLQDMTVPAHVRLEPHPAGDYYEIWVRDNFKAISGQMVSVNNLGQAFDDLALYAHDNFYSVGTIDGGIPYDEIKIGINQVGQQYDYAFKNGYKLVRVKNISNKIFYDFDQTINPDYYAQLAPKAVGYSAGTIAYFQKKFDEIDEQRKTQIQPEISFLGIGKDMLAMTWENANYILNDILGSTEVQVGVDSVVETYNTGNKVANNVIQATTVTVNDTTTKVKQAVVVNKKAIKQIPIKVITPTVDLSKKLVAAAVRPVAPIKEAVLGIKIAEANNDKGISTSTTEIIKPLDVEMTEPLPYTNFVINPFTIYTDSYSKDNDLPIEVVADLPIDPIATATPEIATSSSVENISSTTDDQLPIINENSTSTASSTDNHATTTEPQVARPESIIVAYPAVLSSSSQAEFMLESDMAGVQFEYDLDNSGWQLCTGALPLTVPDGEHIILVRALVLDASSTAIYDETPAAYSWVVDTQSPTVEFVNLPADLNTDSMTINWQSVSLDAQWYNLEENYNSVGWLTILDNTASTSYSIVNRLPVGSLTISLNYGDTKQYRVQTGDLAGNWSGFITSTILRKTADHLLISAVQVNGATADDESIVTQKFWSSNLYAKSIA